MTENQRIFCEEYLKDRNGTRAYKVAYPNVKKDGAARVNAKKLLGNKEVQDFIQERLDEIHSELTADAREVFETLTSVMRGNETGEEVLTIGVGEGRSKIVKVEKKPNIRDKLEAAKQLSKLLGIDKGRESTEQDDDKVVIVNDIS